MGVLALDIELMGTSKAFAKLAIAVLTYKAKVFSYETMFSF